MNKQETQDYENFLLKNFQLKPLDDLSGYYIIDNGLIHYFDKKREYETTKILIQ